MSPEEQDRLRKEEEERKKYPIPPLPDVNKFDKIYILPMFCKPGKHQYMIKYKDTREPGQARLAKRIKKLEKRHRRGKAGQPVTKPFDKVAYSEAKKNLVPECFFYQCEVPKRVEEIPACAKQMQSKVVERAFNKEMSVFNKWRQDTPL